MSTKSFNKLVQQRLAAHGYDVGGITGIIKTSDKDPARQAIRDVQRRGGLAITGKVDDATLALLKKDTIPGTLQKQVVLPPQRPQVALPPQRPVSVPLAGSVETGAGDAGASASGTLAPTPPVPATSGDRPDARQVQLLKLDADKQLQAAIATGDPKAIAGAVAQVRSLLSPQASGSASPPVDPDRALGVGDPHFGQMMEGQGDALRSNVAQAFDEPLAGMSPDEIATWQARKDVKAKKQQDELLRGSAHDPAAAGVAPWQGPNFDAASDAAPVLTGAAVEGARHAFAFASGMAATNTVLNLLESGDHVVCVDNVYGGTYRILTQLYPHYGLTTSFVDGTDPANVLGAIRKETRLVWLETPSNPLLKLCDLKTIVRGVRKKAGRRILVAVDNTFASPVFQSPFAMGADIVMYSLTKYHGGHSDVLAGALITDDRGIAERLGYFQNAVGAVLGPMDCYLVLRGIKTMALRVERHAENAIRVARFLERHPGVRKVYYPGLRSHPQHALAKRQMKGFGSMVSCDLRGGARAARRFAGATKLFALAESLGGVKSLLCLPYFMTHASVPPEEKARIGITEGLIRFSVGIEDAEDLIEDLAQALRRARR